MRSDRDSGQLLHGLGGDTTLRTLEIADWLQPVYSIDDLRFALPNRTTVTLFCSAAPSQAAVNFSGVFIQPRFPCYVTSLIGSVNYQLLVSQTAGGLTVVDGAGIPTTWVFPDQSNMNSGGTTGNALVVPGGANTPGLFNSFDQGRLNANTGGPLRLANTDVCSNPDNWIYLSSARGMFAHAQAANTAITLHFVIRFTAEALRSINNVGTPLVP